MNAKFLIVALLMGTAVPSKAQVPPPPSLPGQDKLAEQLVRSIETKNIKAYADILSDNVLVFEDGNQVADNKTKWLNIFGKKLSAKGVIFKVGPGYSSTGRFLFIEYFNSMGSWTGPVPADCCWSHDAVSYDVTDGKVTVIRRLRGGDNELARIISKP